MTRTVPLPGWVVSGAVDGGEEVVGRMSRELGWELLLKALRDGREEVGWDLQLLSVGVAGIEGGGGGRSIGEFFKGRDTPVLGETPVAGEKEEEEGECALWEEEVYMSEGDEGYTICGVCGVRMLGFAMEAHGRFHSMDEADELGAGCGY